MEGAFAGWKGDFKGFFLGLKLNNSKAYFESHRKQYEQDVKAPMVALLADLESEFGAARISRPNRDIRFSADKSPYKTTSTPPRAPAGMWRLMLEGLAAGGGRHMLEPSQLAGFRKAVDAKASGEKLGAIVCGAAGKGLRRRGAGVETGASAPPARPSPGRPSEAQDDLLLAALAARTVDRDHEGSGAGQAGVA